MTTKKKEEPMATTTEIAKIPDAGAVAEVDWDTIDIPDDGLAGAEIRPVYPRFQIVQGTSKIEGKKGHDGEWYFPGTGEFVSRNITAVIVQAQPNRAGFGDGDLPFCSSPDGIRPRPGGRVWETGSFKTKGGDVVHVPHGEPEMCRACILKEFRDGQKPYCGNGYLLLLDLNCDPDNMDLVRYQVSSTAIAPFEKFIGALRAMRGPRGKVGLPAYSHMVTLRTVETQGKGGMYYQLAFDWTKLDLDTFAKYAQVIGGIREAWQQTVHAEPESDEGAAPAANAGWGDGATPYAEPEHVRAAPAAADEGEWESA